MTVVSIISLIPNLSSDDVIERDSLVYRSYITLGSHELVISEIDSSAPTTMQVVKLLAVYLSGNKIFLEQLESVLQGAENSLSHEELLQRSHDQNISDYVVIFFRFVISGEIRRRCDFFEPFIAGLTNSTVNKNWFDSYCNRYIPRYTFSWLVQPMW